MKILKLTFLIIILSVTFFCSKEDDSQPTKSIQEPVTITNVYVGGSQTINGLEKATIWKNGVAELLNTNLTNESKVNSVFVSGNDVYAVGFEVIVNSRVATLWKNGTKIQLEGSFSEACSVSVFKDVVYISGQLVEKATFWVGINGVFEGNELSSNNNSVAKSIFATNDGLVVNGIYVAGKIGANAWTWISPGYNETIFTTPSVAESIFVRGTDVFVVANYDNAGVLNAKILKNGTSQNSVVNNTAMYSVHGDNQNIYAVGATNPNSVNSRAMIWENFIPKELSPLFSMANSVFVADKNVYVAGNMYDFVSLKFKACLWTNGTIQTLSNEKSETKSVFVTVK
ncbi:hypothetical protein [Flavobacterium sp.]|uniref:hypothetical protein n=1 Tax=Flavobacterium sp. TaxID=239 RepID=UPI00286DB9C7|nr:hypothetical protein [Flavobacterium sp.]